MRCGSSSPLIALALKQVTESSSISKNFNSLIKTFKKYDTITNENATSFKMENVNEIGELDITRDNILSLLTNELSKSDFSKSDWEIFKEEMKRII
jgi:hypothetical protein